MSLKSTAQNAQPVIVIVDESPEDFHGNMPVNLTPMEHENKHDHEQLEVSLEGEQCECGCENCECAKKDEDVLEVAESPEDDLMVEDFVLPDLPGAPLNTPDPQEPALEVFDDNSVMEVDDNDARKAKKNEKWDWQSKGATGFIAWVKERFSAVPGHSGYDSAGLERAKSFLEKLDDEISKAMRLDLDGELDADKIEKVRSQIDDGIARIQGRLDKVIKVKKNKRKKAKAEAIEDGVFIKEAQKITGVTGIVVTVPLLISRIARLCANGMVSAGHDLEEIYREQVKKYSLNIREQAEVTQLLLDMGYALRMDRGIDPDEDFDPAGTNNPESIQQFKG